MPIHGNAASDDILNEAGINKTKALIAALGSDADNLYVTLSARVSRPDIFVVARVSAEESESKLKQAGADRIISPHRNAGRRMAMLTLRPRVVDFIDTTMHCRGTEFILENIKVDEASPVLGKMVKETVSYSGVVAILAVWKADDTLLPNPLDDTLLEQGDELVVIGSHKQLRVLEGTV